LVLGECTYSEIGKDEAIIFTVDHTKILHPAFIPEVQNGCFCVNADALMEVSDQKAPQGGCGHRRQHAQLR